MVTIKTVFFNSEGLGTNIFHLSISGGLGTKFSLHQTYPTATTKLMKVYYCKRVIHLFHGIRTFCYNDIVTVTLTKMVLTVTEMVVTVTHGIMEYYGFMFTLEILLVVSSSWCSWWLENSCFLP